MRPLVAFGVVLGVFLIVLLALDLDFPSDGFRFDPVRKIVKAVSLLSRTAASSVSAAPYNGTTGPAQLKDEATSGQALLNSLGVDYGFIQPPNANNIYTNLGFHSIRSGGDYGPIVTAGFRAYFNSGKPNPNDGFCGSIATYPYDTPATITANILKAERLTVGESYAGGNSPPINISAFLRCIFAESLNEFDSVDTESITPRTGTLSNAVTPNDVSAGKQVSEAIPGFTTSCEAGAGNLFMCGNVVLYVSDGVNSEDVRETCADGGESEPNSDAGVECPAVDGVPQFTAVFRKPHGAETPIYLDVPMTLANSSWNMYQVIKRGSTGHPEFATIELTSDPMASPGSTWVNGAFAGEQRLQGYDSAMLALSRAYDPVDCPNGCHMWTKPEHSAYYIMDALNFHYGVDGGKTYPTEGGGSNNYASRFYGKDIGILRFAGGLYPWQEGTLMSENAIAAGDEFCDGDVSPIVPYCPIQANPNSLPQIVNAEYVATASFAVMAMHLQGSGHVNAVGKLYEPVLMDRSAGLLANSFFDVASNPKPNYYSRANSLAFLGDPTYNPKDFSPDTLTYPNPSPNDWCTSWWNVDSPYVSPAACTTFHYTYKVGSADVMFIQRMQGVGRDLYPEQNNRATCRNAARSGDDGNGTETNYGQCPGVAPPTPFASTVPTSYRLEFSGSVISKARVYQQSRYCGIPTNTEWQAKARPAPDVTPKPVFTKAPNDACFAYTPGPLITPQPDGKIVIEAPVANLASVVQLCHGTETGPCDSIIRPVPMLSPQPTPAVCPTPDAEMIAGQPCPYNLYRTGVYSNVVAR